MATNISEKPVAQLTIDAFRGISGLLINQLSAINIITGDNSVGKTAVLESLFLIFANDQQLDSFPMEFRTSTRDWTEEWNSFWKWLLPGNKIPGSISLKWTFGNGFKGTLDAGMTSDELSNIIFHKSVENLYASRRTLSPVSGGGLRGGGNYSGQYVWPRITNFNYANTTRAVDAEKFSRLAATADGEERMLDLVKIIDSRVTKLRYLKITSVPLVYADIGLGNLIPISQMGQGFGILFSLFTELLTAKTEILLIDEIENGIHRDAMPKVWEGLARMVKAQNIQLFATTHSKECVTAAFEASKASEGVTEFTRHNLKRVGEKVVCTTHTDVI